MHTPLLSDELDVDEAGHLKHRLGVTVTGFEEYNPNSPRINLKPHREDPILRVTKFMGIGMVIGWMLGIIYDLLFQ